MSFFRFFWMVLLAHCAVLSKGQLTAPQILHGDTLVQEVMLFLDLETPNSEGTTIWDASEGSPINQSTSVVSSAGLTPWGKSFGSATFGVESSGATTYYGMDQGFTYFGGVQSGIVVTYDNPEVYMPFPFGVNPQATWSDDFSGDYQLPEFTVERQGQVLSSYRGSGTLISLEGVSIPVHMVDVVETVVDSFSIGNVYEVVLTSRFLYDGIHFVPRLGSSEVSEVIYDAFGNVLDAGESAYSLRLSDYVMDAHHLANPGNEWTVFPNPVRAGGDFSVVWGAFGNAPESLKLLDTNGREVAFKRVWPGAPSTSMQVPSSCDPGTYVLQMLGKHPQSQSIVVTP